VTDQGQIPPAQRIAQVLLTALTRRDADAIAYLASGDAARWEAACARARDHRCLPYLVWVLDSAGTVPARPVDPALRRRWLLRALAIQRECVRLHGLLSEAGIAHLFLKGVPLAAAAYPEPWLRPLRDIDILVAPDDLGRAQALLLGHGGAMARHAHKADTPADRQAKHLVPVWSPGRVIAVEVHGHAADARCGLGPEAIARLDAALWQGAAEVPLGGARLPVPGPEALFVHLVLHGLYDHELDNGPLFVTDLRHLLERMRPDPQRVVALAGALGLCRGLALALSLLPDDAPGRAALAAALCAGGGAGDLPALPGDLAAALLLQDAALRGEMRLAADLAARGAGARLRLLAGRLLASRETMTTRWRMAGHTTPPPAATAALWLWFVATRLRGMRRAGRAVPAGREHLMRLRALRDGRAG
jgi:hypothetical protein